MVREITETPVNLCASTSLLGADKDQDGFDDSCIDGAMLTEKFSQDETNAGFPKEPEP